MEKYGIIPDSLVRRQVQETLENFASYTKFVLLLIGAVASNLFDVLIGGTMLSLVFKDINIGLGNPWSGIFIGFLSSFVLMFIQLILWDIILKEGFAWNDFPLFVLALIVSIGDTNIDISPIYTWVAQSVISADLKNIVLLAPFQTFTLYDFVAFSIFWSFYIALMFSEAFNIWFLRSMSLVIGSRGNFKSNVGRQQRKSNSPSFNRQTIPKEFAKKFSDIGFNPHYRK